MRGIDQPSLVRGWDHVAESASLWASTGIPGLDDILGGGFPSNRVYLVEGDPGTGKTTLALQFLLEGIRRGEKVLYVALSETEQEIRGVAQSHGWNMEGMTIFPIAALANEKERKEDYTLFHPAEVELNETLQSVRDQVEKVQPVRVVIDSLAEMRLLAQDALLYRRQILALKHFFVGRRCTVLLLDDRTPHVGDIHFQSLVHGVIVLEQTSPVFGRKRRRLEVTKLRGVGFRDGHHDFTIRKGGLKVFPRLVAAEHHQAFERGVVSSGLPSLDNLLGGGLDRGTSTLIMGPAGVGKSTLALQYVLSASERGERATIYTFDEGLGILRARARGLGLPLDDHMQSGNVVVRQIDPAELSPGEFAHLVRQAVEEEKSRVILIDSLNGYQSAMPEERMLIVQLHELLTYLNQQGVLSLLVVSQHGMLGHSMETPIDVSYLADTVLLLRYFETAGEVRQAVSVVKRRSGQHERSIRELGLGPNGVRLGEQLREFHGVLTGVPVYHGKASPLLGKNDGKLP